MSPTDRLLETLEAEFTYLFGGCTLQRRLGWELSFPIRRANSDQVTVIYTDAPYSFSQNLSLLSIFADELRAKAEEMLEEEAILVVVMPVYHSE